MSLARALKICRAAAELEQQELATALGVSPSFLSLVESGKRTLSPERISEACKILGVPEDLFALLAAEPEDVTEIAWEDLQAFSDTLLSILFRGRIA